jgi:hypothetical protein
MHIAGNHFTKSRWENRGRVPEKLTCPMLAGTVFFGLLRDTVSIGSGAKKEADRMRLMKFPINVICLLVVCIPSGSCTTTSGNSAFMNASSQGPDLGYRLFNGCGREVGETSKKRACSAILTALREQQWTLQLLDKETFTIYGKYCYRSQSAYCVDVRFESKKDGSVVGRVTGMTNLKLKKRMDVLFNGLNRSFRNQICKTDEALSDELKNYGISLP